MPRRVLFFFALGSGNRKIFAKTLSGNGKKTKTFALLDRNRANANVWNRRQISTAFRNASLGGVD
ncbi:MAG: hypothetical protein IJE97_16710 [Thermoguttaceae bacterium]|nr:hypothetical protein [Thermoguttaceae bacterium]MBQ6826840.1 hypothetical protein [Thermoguttaceae bacterium]